MSILATANLVTLAEVKEFVEQKDASKDIVLEYMIDAVSSRFNTFTRRFLRSAVYTAQKFNGTGEPDFWLPNYPVGTLSLVKEDGLTLALGVDFLSYPYDGMLLKKDEKLWTTLPQGVEVTYTAGYALADVPSDLKYSSLKQIAFEFWKQKSKAFGVDSRSYPDGSVTTSVRSNLLKEVEDVLFLYRRLKVV